MWLWWIGALLAAVVVLWLGFVLAMRAKFRPVQDTLRRVNRSVFNPRTLRSAGEGGQQWSVVRHVGRTTGTEYETPIDANPTGDGFVIPLPYGTTADWVRNVLAAESAEIVHDGVMYPVDRPEVVPSEAVAAHVPAKQQRTDRLYGVDHYLALRQVGW